MRQAVVLLALVSMAAHAEDHTHHHAAPPSGDAQIVVTINPEARVSATLGAGLPPPVACGEATELKVKIVNQGGVTAPLHARLTGDGARHAALHMDVTNLSGQSEDLRLLHLIPQGPGSVDVTVAFSIDNNVGDLGGRDRVHFLVRATKKCR